MSLLRLRRRPPAPAPLVRDVEWPFAGHLFPPELGCVASGSVASGGLPVLQVAHAPDGTWLVSDGLGFPTGAEGDMSVALRGLAETDPSLGVLAVMLPPGSQADRSAPDRQWRFSPFEWPEES